MSAASSAPASPVAPSPLRPLRMPNLQETLPRLDGEPPAAYEALLIYAEQTEGERSQVEVAVTLKGKYPKRYTGTIRTLRSRLAGYSARYRWIERVATYDAAIHDALRRDADIAVRMMNTEMARHTNTIADLASRHLRNLLTADLVIGAEYINAVQHAIANRAPLPPLPKLNVPARDLVTLQRNAQEMLRVALGEAAVIESERESSAVTITFSADTGVPTLPPDVAGSRAETADHGFVGFDPSVLLPERTAGPEPLDADAALLAEYAGVAEGE